MRYVVCAVHELSRHATKPEAEQELASYEPDGKITYVIVRLPEGGGTKVAAPDRRARGSNAGSRVRKSQSRKGSRGRK